MAWNDSINIKIFKVIAMKDGLYEKVVDRGLHKVLGSKRSEQRKIDDHEVPKVLSLAYQKAIYQALLEKPKNERVELINKLNNLIKIDEFISTEGKFKELLLVHGDAKRFKELKAHRPQTALSLSRLFAGHTQPSLESELLKEISTADEILFLVSFIRWSGLRLIIDRLQEFTKRNKLKVITTSYMGASDYRAILELAKLPNTEVKVSYDSKRTRLHAKAYYFKRYTGFSTAYIGSSNLSNPALTSGLEWNMKVSEYTSKDVIDSFVKNFDTYWYDDEFVYFSPEDEEHRKTLKKSLSAPASDDKPHYTFFNLRPYAHQREILEDLKTEREEHGSYENLVVAATGTGKTMVAAFDYKEQVKGGDKRLLFLAHRKEILEQSLTTFRHVLKNQNFGEMWAGGLRPADYTHLFATVQTLNSAEKYERFPKDYFDYIVIDESHHAAASTYLRIIKYFTPKILLGLTATPERMDGANILEYFNQRIASEIRLTDAINRKLLVPFHYFGVTDPEDLRHLTWSRGGYEISELENVYTKSKQRLEVIVRAMKKYLNDIKTFKALGFCVSIKHAEFMASSFNKAGISSIALHANTDSEERRQAKTRLKNGKINCIFTVDLFNEGVDIPEIDTVLFLRPTESLTIFIQQLGRGLRLSEDKEVLTVLDFIGQAHRNYDFSRKLRLLMGKSKDNIETEIVDEFPSMPAGCSIKIEKIAQEYILNNIQSSVFNRVKLRQMIESFSHNFTQKLTLENFLNCYDIEQNKFYARHSFYKLLSETGLKDDYRVADEKELRHALRRFSRVDSKRLLDFSKKLLKEEIKANEMSPIEQLMLGMFHYTVWDDRPQKSYKESLERLILRNKDIALELLEIIELNKKNIRLKEIAYEEEHIPLDIYASYTMEQVLVALGKTTEKSKYPMREGVLYIEEHHTDLFFITINKNEEDYLPSTMYNDYAINRELFHWESQSSTSIDSPTGIRYTQNRSSKHKVLLFVRENKKEHKVTAPYRFLGNARYLSHEGSKPVQIIWKMDHLIPERIIRESSLRVVN